MRRLGHQQVADARVPSVPNRAPHPTRWTRPVLVAVATALVIAWPLDWSLAALHSLPDRTAGFGVPLLREARDVVANVLVFAPLGWVAAAARWRSFARIGLLALALSMTCEAAQIFQPLRIISVLDVALNTLGAVGGTLSYRAARASLQCLHNAAIRPSLVAVAGVAIAAGLFAYLQGPFAGVDRWPLDDPLQIGNEATGDRPWCGEVAGLAFTTSDRSWTKDSFAWKQQNAGNDAPCAVWLQTATPPAHLVAAVRRAGSVRLELSARPAPLDQGGPARIISISRDPDTRSLTVGQEGRDLVVRIRRRWSGANGVRPYYRIADAFTGDVAVSIVVEAGSDSTVIRAGTHVLVHRHVLERQWWLPLVPRLEWRRGAWEVPLAVAFWTLLLGPSGALTGAAMAGRSGTAAHTLVLGGVTGVAGWLALRAAGVAVAPESLLLMPLAAALPAELVRRRLRPPPAPVQDEAAT